MEKEKEKDDVADDDIEDVEKLILLSSSPTLSIRSVPNDKKDFYRQKTKELYTLHASICKIEKEIVALYTILKLKTPEDETFQDIENVLAKKMEIRAQLQVKEKQIAKNLNKALRNKP